MISTAKILVPDSEWLVKDQKEKIGSISKHKKGYFFLHKGKKIPFKDLTEIKAQFGIAIFEESLKKIKPAITDDKGYNIYDYPCSSKPYEPLYSVKKKLPLYAKSSKSKSQYCAGYYVIKFRKGWVKSFCPKLITLERYPYHGPFKTESEMKSVLNSINKS
jgi:hypothetical protein